MKTSPNDDDKFQEYEEFWRRVLVDILGWPESMYVEFTLRQRTHFHECEVDIFFHDLPYKYVCRELLSERLKQMLQGGDAIRASYLLMDALSGGPYESLCKKDFDIESSRGRYHALLEKLERGLEV
jgi:hypothetical protein